MAYKPNIRRLVDDRDIDGLVQALRYPEDPAIRASAAGALGKIGKVETVESLIRSYLQDPNPGVQQAGLNALHQIIGGEAELAISAYALPEDTWVEDKVVSSEPLPGEMEESDSGEESAYEDDEEDEDDIEDDEDDLEEEDQEGDEEQDPEDVEITWGESDIPALLSIIRVDLSRKKRLKAIQALSQIPNTRAIDALASIALWGEEKWLREAAREALSAIYGDSLEEVLQSYREGSSEAGTSEEEDEDDDDDEDEEEEEEDEDDLEDEFDEDDEEDEEDEDNDEDQDEEDENIREDEENQYLPLIPPSSISPVIREEKQGWGTYLLLGLLLIIILAGVIYLLTR